MDSAREDRWGPAVTLGAVACVGVSALTGGVGPPGTSPLIDVLWWLTYLLYVAIVLVRERLVPQPRRVSQSHLVAAQVAMGVVIWLLSPGAGWVAILLVVSAANAAAVWPPRIVAMVVAGQTVAVAVGAATAGLPAVTVWLSVLGYGTFQAFAAIVVRTGQREAEARRELATAHANLRATTKLLESSSRNAERLRISRELHDVVGHELTALALELEVANHLVHGDATEHVERARRITKDLLHDVRATVGHLRQATPDLADALRELATGLPGLDVDVQVDQDIRLDEQRTMAVLRCAQEAITNTLRHAGATRLHIDVTRDEEGVRLLARDNGRGILGLRPGHGLLGMQERLAEVGGSIHFESPPEGGFRVLARVPTP